MSSPSRRSDWAGAGAIKRMCYGCPLIKGTTMPRYEYRNLAPTPPAQKTFLDWIEQLDSEFREPDPEHRSNVVRDALHQLYLGKERGQPAGSLAQQALIHSFDPRNATLEPEYYGDVDAPKY